jgi:hypothetical protein
MMKKGAKKQAVGWTASSFSEVDLVKLKKEGFLAESVEVIFPNTRVIPAPQPGFWVMFLAFLVRGFSLPAHEFLRGLLFLRRAATSAHAKFPIAHCLLHHSV